MKRLPHREEIMGRICEYDETGTRLFPTSHAKILVDNDYIMASLGVLSKAHREGAIRLLEKSLGVNFDDMRPTEDALGIKSASGAKAGQSEVPGALARDVARSLRRRTRTGRR